MGAAKSNLTAANLGEIKPVVTIKNMPTPLRRNSSIGYEAIRQKKITIYQTFLRRYQVQLWGDIDYKKYHSTLFPESDWNELKREIFQIYEKHNVKLRKLRDLVKYNPYRSMCGWVGTFLRDTCVCSKPSESDPSSSTKCLRMCLIVGLDIMMISFMIIFLPLFIIDLITFPRFLCYAKNHERFIESVMMANPELDPDLIEEQCKADLTDLAMRTSSKFRTVYCVFHSGTDHFPRNGSSASYDVEYFEFQLFNQPPPTPLNDLA